MADIKTSAFGTLFFLYNTGNTGQRCVKIRDMEHR